MCVAYSTYLQIIRNRAERSVNLTSVLLSLYREKSEHYCLKIDDREEISVNGDDLVLLSRILVGEQCNLVELGFPSTLDFTRMRRILHCLLYKVEFSRSSNYKNERVFVTPDIDLIQSIVVNGAFGTLRTESGQELLEALQKIERIATLNF